MKRKSPSPPKTKNEGPAFSKTLQKLQKGWASLKTKCAVLDAGMSLKVGSHPHSVALGISTWGLSFSSVKWKQ